MTCTCPCHVLHRSHRALPGALCSRWHTPSTPPESSPDLSSPIASLLASFCPSFYTFFLPLLRLTSKQRSRKDRGSGGGAPGCAAPRVRSTRACRPGSWLTATCSAAAWTAQNRIPARPENSKSRCAWLIGHAASSFARVQLGQPQAGTCPPQEHS